MMTRPLIAAGAAIVCVLGASPVYAASTPPVIYTSQSSIRWQSGAHARMTIYLHVADATSVSVQMTGYVYGSTPKPGLHLYKRTGRFVLSHVGGDSWIARRTDTASVGAAMSDEAAVGVHACNPSGCVNTTVYFHRPGE